MPDRLDEGQPFDITDGTPDFHDYHIDVLGGQQNIVTVDNCATRLRLRVNDATELPELTGTVGVTAGASAPETLVMDIVEVVRGTDLLDSTPRQIYLQQLLNYPTPAYCHLPLAVDDNGNKISKSEGAARVDIDNREQQLFHVLVFLGQDPPAELARSDISDIWAWAMKHWSIDLVSHDKTVTF